MCVNPPARLRWHACMQANVWIAIFSYVGNYFWTHYFFKVLGASYTFKSWRLNEVRQQQGRQSMLCMRMASQLATEPATVLEVLLWLSVQLHQPLMLHSHQHANWPKLRIVPLCVTQVPICLYLMTHAYFCFYHAISNVLLRKVRCQTCSKCKPYVSFECARSCMHCSGSRSIHACTFRNKLCGNSSHVCSS